MVFLILPASIPDIRQTYDCYFEAFAGSTVSEILFPWDVQNEEFRAAHTASTLEYWHKRESIQQYTCKCIDTETDEIVGFGLWDVNWKEREGGSSQPAVDWLEGAQKERAEGLIMPLAAKKEELLRGSKHVYCHVIAVKPDFERRGIGAMLTRWGLDIAEQLRVPTYLEATDKSVKLYERLGFERLVPGVTLKASIMNTEMDVEAPVMVKMPSSAAGISFDEWVERGRPDLWASGSVAGLMDGS